MKTMRALTKTRPGAGNVELVEIPEPECPPDRVKVEVAFGGVCGTDIHVYYDRFPSYPPVILGHEFSGVVVEAGEQVQRVKPGERVTVLGSTAITCGTCEYCQSGDYMFCGARRGMGHGTHGCFTRYVVVREDQIYKLPEAVSLEEGALSEPFASAVQAVEEVDRFRTGDMVLLSGPGPIGLACLLLLARRTKVIVAGTEHDGVRLKLARELGADRTVDVSREPLGEVVEQETGGRGVDVAIEAAGAPESVLACLRAVRRMGRYLHLGILGREVSVPFDTLLYKQVQVRFSVGHSLKTWRRAMRILEQRKLDLQPLITHILPLSRWREAFQLCENKQGVKVLLKYEEM